MHASTEGLQSCTAAGSFQVQTISAAGDGIDAAMLLSFGSETSRTAQVLLDLKIQTILGWSSLYLLGLWLSRRAVPLQRA